MAIRIQMRRGTAAEWTAANPVLATGEQGYETDTGNVKYGDGTTAWASLPYGVRKPGPGEVIVGGTDGPVPVAVEDIGGGAGVADAVRQYTGSVNDIARRLARRPPNVIGYDFFDRPDTTSGLGTADCGQTWAASSDWRILGTSAQPNASSRSMPFIYNLHLPDEIEVVVDTPDSGSFDFGPSWRGTTADTTLYLSCRSTTNDIRLVERSGASHTTLATVADMGWQNGRRYTVTVRDTGTHVSVLVNDVEKLAPFEVVRPALTGANVGITVNGGVGSNSPFRSLVWRRRLLPRRKAFARNVAHRGMVNGMPENSLVSLAHLPGNVDAIEIDVLETADQAWVCMHDSTVDRTTNGTGAVSSLTKAQVTSLLIDNGGGPVPTMHEMMDAAYEKGVAEIHLDVGGSGSTRLTRVWNALTGHPALSRTVFFLSNASEATALRAVAPAARIAIGGVTAANAATEVPAAASAGVELVYLAAGDAAYTANRAVVPSILAAGMKAGASTVNTPTTQRQAADDGVTVLLTDYAAMVNV